MLLAFDSSSASPSLALRRANGEIVIATLPQGRGQADRLPELLNDLLTAEKVPIAAIRNLAVTRGPGSYTGIRTCLALVKGLALARKLPVLGCTAFDCLFAAGEAGDGDLALVDAGRGRIYGMIAGKAEGAMEPLDDLVKSGGKVGRIIASQLVLDNLPANLVAPQKIGIEVTAKLICELHDTFLAKGYRETSGRDVLPLYINRADAQLSAGKSLVASLVNR